MRQQEQEDGLRLAVLLAQCQGAKGLAEYVAPAERWADYVEEERVKATLDPVDKRARRRAEVLAFIEAAGGDVG